MVSLLQKKLYPIFASLYLDSGLPSFLTLPFFPFLSISHHLQYTFLSQLNYPCFRMSFIYPANRFSPRASIQNSHHETPSRVRFQLSLFFFFHCRRGSDPNEIPPFF